MKNLWVMVTTRPEAKYVLIAVGLIVAVIIFETVWEIYKLKREHKALVTAKNDEEEKARKLLKEQDDLIKWRASLKDLVKTRKVPCIVRHGDNTYKGRVHWYKEDTDVFEFSDKVNTSFEKLEVIFPLEEVNT